MTHIIHSERIPRTPKINGKPLKKAETDSLPLFCIFLWAEKRRQVTPVIALKLPSKVGAESSVDYDAFVQSDGVILSEAVLQEERRISRANRDVRPKRREPATLHATR
jgi:hypothetical protein